jgi:hypothetical protein
MKAQKPKSTWLHYAWNILFALFYPFLLTFSILFTGIVWFFSALSRLLFKILSSFSRHESENISE